MMIVVVGGKNRTGQIQRKASSTKLGPLPPLPLAISHQCLVIVNDTTLFSTGGFITGYIPHSRSYVYTKDR
jgi:hypothetical protein